MKVPYALRYKVGDEGGCLPVQCGVDGGAEHGLQAVPGQVRRASLITGHREHRHTIMLSMHLSCLVPADRRCSRVCNCQHWV